MLYFCQTVVDVELAKAQYNGCGALDSRLRDDAVFSSQVSLSHYAFFALAQNANVRRSCFEVLHFATYYFK